MYKVGDFYGALDQFAPFYTAEDWDNVGMLAGDMDAPVTRALCALDATDAVIDEAAACGANLIVTHHPVIFPSVKNIAAPSAVWRIIRENMSVICAHTNLDMAAGGVNDTLADLLKLENQRPMAVTARRPYKKIVIFVPEQAAQAVRDAMFASGAGLYNGSLYADCSFESPGTGRFRPLDGARPSTGAVGRAEAVPEIRLEMLADPDRLDYILAAAKQVHPYEAPAIDVFEAFGACKETALGVVGELPAAMEPGDFARFVRDKLALDGLKYVDGGRDIKTVAVCGGGGTDYFSDAVKAGADAYVTGESKHHILLEA
ncbi:MAG: Nif3-like dinuclear metal center hexameric protein, partial [Oscillospiraceae bacterium]|nr:Nif3-like dinuclear metal center hexameric protein [Oscillospiraceae bacterium]